MTFKAEAGDTTFYNYDNLGNLISVLLPDDTFIEYIIDGQNRRIGKVVNGTFKKGWLYQDQLNPVAELDSLGNILSRFVYANKGHVPDYMVQGDSTYRFITDHLGSVRLVVNVESGHIAQRIDYDEFGNILINTNPDFQPFGYAGGLTDSQTGLVRFDARDYDAEVGRWTAKDPIGFEGNNTNFYGYVLSDPVNWLDPKGLFRFCKRSLVPGLTHAYPWMQNPITDKLNIELVHEHGFFEDVCGVNIGFRKPSLPGLGNLLNTTGRFEEDPKNFKYYTKCENKYYEDDIIREALRNIQDGRYNLISNNCQHWSDRLRKEYNRIYKLRTQRER